MTWLAFDSTSYNYVNYEYDSNGEKIKESGDLYTYDEYGRVISADTDSVSGGISDMNVTYEYA